MHSSVRKQLFQRMKNKMIRQYEVRQRWLNLIENMTHERSMWHEEECEPGFFMLDQTEGPNRERRRLRKDHLYLDERFFKAETRPLLAAERRHSRLRYLAGDPQSISSGDYMLYHKANELLILK